MVRIAGARRVLEIGTLGGYSTIWLARSVPEGGVVVTIESNALHAGVARENFAAAALGEKIRLIEKDATAALTQLTVERVAPFDWVFIDADKPSNPAYLALVLDMVHSGSVIIGDNLVRDGEIANPASDDPSVVGVRRYCEDLKAKGLASAGVQTVGIKGHDGFSISIVP